MMIMMMMDSKITGRRDHHSLFSRAFSVVSHYPSKEKSEKQQCRQKNSIACKDHTPLSRSEI